MAVLFSVVTVTAGNEKTEFLVGGVPREYGDLEGWRKFGDFLDELDQESKVSVHADSYLYGEDEVFTATAEEVAYFMMRIEQKPSFLQNSCTKGESSEFDFQWSPEELFGLEMKLL